MKDSILHGIEMYILISLIVSGTITILAASSFYVVQAQTSGTSTTTQGEADIADTVMSYITQAESALATGNSTAASDRLGQAIAELSTLIGIITSGEGRHTDTHTHTITHEGNTHHITHTHPHNQDHHHNNWFHSHHIFNPSDCKPGLMC
jgi:long-subunit fatty acid transport protein